MSKYKTEMERMSDKLIRSLNSRIKGFVADSEGDQKIIEELKLQYNILNDTNKVLHETIDAKCIELKETTNQFNKIIIETENKAKSWANIAIISSIVFIIAFIAYICK